jgi:hypothetical protein
MRDEIEIDLERPDAVRDRSRREPACRQVQRDMPGMIHPGTLGEPDLSNDLGPQVQSRVRARHGTSIAS